MPFAEQLILQVAPSDVGGGAEKVAADLHRSYLARGLDAWLAVAVDHGTLTNTVHIPRPYERHAWPRTLIGAADSLGVAPSNGHGPRWALDRCAPGGGGPRANLEVLRGDGRTSDSPTPTTCSNSRLDPPLSCTCTTCTARTSTSARCRRSARPSHLPDPSRRLAADRALRVLRWTCEGWREGCGECQSLDIYVPLARDGSAVNRAVKFDAVKRSRPSTSRRPPAGSPGLSRSRVRRAPRRSSHHPEWHRHRTSSPRATGLSRAGTLDIDADAPCCCSRRDLPRRVRSRTSPLSKRPCRQSCLLRVREPRHDRDRSRGARRNDRRRSAPVRALHRRSGPLPRTIEPPTSTCIQPVPRTSRSLCSRRWRAERPLWPATQAGSRDDRRWRNGAALPKGRLGAPRETAGGSARQLRHAQRLSRRPWPECVPSSRWTRRSIDTSTGTNPYSPRRRTPADDDHGRPMLSVVVPVYNTALTCGNALTLSSHRPSRTSRSWSWTTARRTSRRRSSPNTPPHDSVTVIRKTNGGPADARNRGIEAARASTSASSTATTTCRR